ncbi:uncharacterized protein LOC144767878 [Lissotriton helveticus]
MQKILVLSLVVLVVGLAHGHPWEHEEEQSEQPSGDWWNEVDEKSKERPGQCPAESVTVDVQSTQSPSAPPCVNGTNGTAPNCTSGGSLPTPSPDCTNGTNGTAPNCTSGGTLPTPLPDCTNGTAPNCTSGGTLPTPSPDCTNGTNGTAPNCTSGGTLPTPSPDCTNGTNGTAPNCTSGGTLPTPLPDCPNGTNGTAPNCTSPGTLPTSAPECAVVTAQSCSEDSVCPKSQKCCQTSCGRRCLDPIPGSFCIKHEDCALDAKLCCRGVCAYVCRHRPLTDLFKYLLRR